jgi:hypothetical protein
MRNLLCLTALLLLASPTLVADARAEQLATTIEASWSFGERGLGASDTVVIGDLFGAVARYQVPFSTGIGVETEYAPEPSDLRNTMGSDLRLRVYSIDSYLYTFDIPGSTAAGTRSFVENNNGDGFGTITNHFDLTFDQPYVRTTWTIHDFSRVTHPDPQFNLLTTFTMTGRFYSTAPEPGSLLLLCVGGVFLVHVRVRA